MSVTRIRVKERDAIIQSLKSGVTPRIGIQHIQVGLFKCCTVYCVREEAGHGQCRPFSRQTYPLIGRSGS